MKDVEINIQEFAFLIGRPLNYASDLFKTFVLMLNKKYSRKMRVPIRELDNSRKSLLLVENALDIHNNYFKRYESKFRLLNDKKCIEKQAWIGKNAAVKVFLKPEDVATIESNWKQKREEFYNQQGLFGVVPVLVPVKKKRVKQVETVKSPN